MITFLYYVYFVLTSRIAFKLFDLDFLPLIPRSTICLYFSYAHFLLFLTQGKEKVEAILVNQRVWFWTDSEHCIQMFLMETTKCSLKKRIAVFSGQSGQ